MCGIIGVALKRGNAAAEVYDGLERLEYRGYDSAGMSVKTGDGTVTIKRGGALRQRCDGAHALGNSRRAVGQKRAPARCGQIFCRA